MSGARAARARPGALVALTGAQFAIGAAAIFARYALAGAGALAVSAGRLSIAAFAVAIVALFARRRIARDPKTELRLVLAGVMLAVHFGCWIASLQYTSVAVSTLLVTTTPVFTEVVRTLRERRLRPLAVTSIVCALGGVVLVTGPLGGGDSARTLGALLALAGAVAIAAYLLLVRASATRYDTLAVVSRTYPIAAFALVAAAALAQQRPPALGNTSAWAGIVAMALVSQLFGHTALNLAVRSLSATFVAMTTLVEPVIAAALAAWLFRERLEPATLLGALLILGAIALALRDEFTGDASASHAV